MIGGISKIGNNFISQPPFNMPEREETEPIEPVRETPVNTVETVADSSSDEAESPRPSKEEWAPNFDWAVKCLSENLIRSVDLLTLSKIAKYVKDNFDTYLRQAEDVHAFLEDTQIPAIDPSRPIPAFTLAKVRSALYKEMGGLLRYLNAVGKFKEYGDLILVGLFGEIPKNPRITLASLQPTKRMESLKFSVMSQLHIPFSDLPPNRQRERLEYYDMFYVLLNQKEEIIDEIEKKYSIFSPLAASIDWDKREIGVSTATFQSIIYLSKKYFKDIIDFAIDLEMEVRIVYLILQVVLRDKALLFHIPDNPAVFVLKDAMVDVNESVINRQESSAAHLFKDTPVQHHLSCFVENVLFKSNAVRLCLGKEEFEIGGTENDFPIEKIKSYFLKEIVNINPQEMVLKIKECPALSKIIGKNEKLGKIEFSNFLRCEYEKFNNAKTTKDGNFIIYRLNQLCDGVQFNERELKGLSKDIVSSIDFLFPLFLLQILVMTNDNFSDEFKKQYRSKKCVNGHCDNVSHLPEGLDAHKFIYRTHFSEESVTGYSVIGTLSISSFWAEAQVKMILFKKISFSPFISFDTFSKLSENVFLDIESDAFELNIMEQFKSICSEMNQSIIDNIDVLKERLYEIIFIKDLLDDLKVSIHIYRHWLLRLESFEEAIREKMWVSRDPELGHYYLRIYAEDGFLRKSH